ncbi:MAG: HAD family hydrolase [Actinobacteria bacterium]|nr:MAG: HAD family hydrolase [Actinomycetota bacterium]
MLRAVFFDFGGVILSSPFDAFNHYERQHGLPQNFIRSVNSVNHHENAWAMLERSDISPTEFNDVFAAESEVLGHRIPGADILALLHGELRPDMVHALDVIKHHRFILACLTNNVLTQQVASVDPTERARQQELQAVLARFDAVIESSKVGVRKPEPRFYEIACETVGVQPDECVFLDDLGINLKPAAQMGMITIKVATSEQALSELAQIIDLDLSMK